MRKDSYQDVRAEVNIMAYKPQPKGDNLVIGYLSVLIDRPLLIEELEVPFGWFKNRAQEWLHYHNLNCTIAIENGQCILRRTFSKK